MKNIVQIISWIALIGIIVPPLVFLMGGMELSSTKTWMLVATVVWFVTVPLWMGRKESA